MVLSLASLGNDEDDVFRKRVFELLGEFRCSKSEHLERYARSAVSSWEKHGHSRTYVFVAPDSDDGICVPAFFAVGMNVLDFSKASNSVKKRLMGQISQDRTGAYCIAELARDDRFTSEQVPGSVILAEARDVVVNARQFIGGRYLIVDSTQKVFDELYSKHGFRKIGLAEPPKGMEGKDFVTSCQVIRDE